MSEAATVADTGYEHVTKVVRPQASLTLRSTVLKWYEIAPADAPVPLVVRALARRNLRDASKDGSLRISGDFGFVILHRCGEDFYFLLVSTWQNENELWETVWAKDGERMFCFKPWSGRGHTPSDVLRVGARRGVSRAPRLERVPALAARRDRQGHLPRLLLRGRGLKALSVATYSSDGEGCANGARQSAGSKGSAT